MSITGTVGLMTYKRTPEHQAKLNAAQKGRKLSPEAIAKRTETRRANDGYGLKHGHNRGGPETDLRTPTYTSWDNMIQRCTNPRRQEYKHYGGRSISVCGRWMTFANFLADMGVRPDGRTLDRIDNDGNYEPGNCRWATKAEQLKNRRRQSNYDRPARTPECGHPDREHKARGMCGGCYRRWRLSTDERDPRYMTGRENL